jgi:hypothetical protein
MKASDILKQRLSQPRGIYDQLRRDKITQLQNHFSSQRSLVRIFSLSRFSVAQ